MPSTRPLTAALLVLAAVGAGCTDSGDSDSAEGDRLSDIVSETQGALRGTVLDESLFPILEALIVVRLDGSEVASVRTDTAGEFVVPLVEPGTYVVNASAFQMRSRETKADVLAGEETGLQIILSDEASKEPFLDLRHRRGYQPCAAALVLTPASFARFCEPNNDRSDQWIPVPAGYHALVLETTWQTTSEEFAHFFYCCNFTRDGGTYQLILDYTWGSSPTKSVLLPGVQNKKPQGPAAFQYGPLPNGTEILLHSRGFWAGSQAQYTQALLPACQQLSYDRCSGVGFNPGFAFDFWVTMFMNGLDRDPREFSALPDR